MLVLHRADTRRRSGRTGRAVAHPVLEYGLPVGGDWVATVLVQVDAWAEDIERAARRSLRHQALADRGDHLALRNMHSWAVADEHALRTGFGASAPEPNAGQSALETHGLCCSVGGPAAGSERGEPAPRGQFPGRCVTRLARVRGCRSVTAEHVADSSVPALTGAEHIQARRTRRRSFEPECASRSRRAASRGHRGRAPGTASLSGATQRSHCRRTGTSAIDNPIENAPRYR